MMPLLWDMFCTDNVCIGVRCSLKYRTIALYIFKLLFFVEMIEHKGIPYVFNSFDKTLEQLVTLVNFLLNRSDNRTIQFGCFHESFV